MSTVTVIPSRDAQAWRAALGVFPDADVYHDPCFAGAAAPADLWTVGDGADALAVILARQALPEWLDEAGGDAETPNGYAAPLAIGAGERLWPALAAALAQAGVVNAFLRLHPFLPHRVDPAWYLGAPHPTAWIPLEAGLSGAFAGGRCSTHRSQVSRAERLGHAVRLTLAPTAARLDGFRSLYDLTMQRLGASTGYRFEDGYFHALVGLGDRLALVEVTDAAGVLVNAALFMRGAAWCHYHLSARGEQAHNSSGHLLFTAAAAWAAEHGCRGIHLGGGTSAEPTDPLLVYKRRIGRGDAEFRTAGVVVDAERHQRLRAEWSQRSGRPGRWFQAYREPLA